VGHEKYEDIAVRNNLAPALCSAAEFADAMARVKHTHPEAGMDKEARDLVLRTLGIKEDWAERLATEISSLIQGK
jgi:hypothetical protein